MSVLALGTTASAIPLLYPYWHQASTASDRLSQADLTARAAPQRLSKYADGDSRSGTRIGLALVSARTRSAFHLQPEFLVP
jgi:hypothetical protein